MQGTWPATAKHRGWAPAARRLGLPVGWDGTGVPLPPPHPVAAACQPGSASKRGLLLALGAEGTNAHHRQPEQLWGCSPPQHPALRLPHIPGQSRSCPGHPHGAGGVPTPACALDQKQLGENYRNQPKHAGKNPEGS